MGGRRRHAGGVRPLHVLCLVLTGAVWLVADQLKDSPEGELWQRVSSSTLMVHGGTAMVALLLLGALYPLHIRLGWRRAASASRRDTARSLRRSGSRG